MDPYETKESKTTTSWWIASLAISILVCAVFAAYLFDFKEDLVLAKIRAETLEQRMDTLAAQVESLQRRTMVQQIQVVPTDAAAPLPVINLPTTGGAQPASPPPEPTAPAAITPPPASPAPIAVPPPAEPPPPAK